MNHYRFCFLCLLCIGLSMSACKPEATTDTNKVTYKRTENVVHVRSAAEPDVLNPILTTSAYSRYVYEQIFMPLLEIDPRTMESVPALAKGLPAVSEITEGPYAGGRGFTYELWKEAKWDDGSDVTGEDVIFTLKAILNPKVGSVYRPYFDMIKDIEVDPNNPKKFTILTDGNYFLTEPTLSALDIYPEYIFDPEKLMRNFPLASLTDTEQGQQLADKDERMARFAETFSSAEFGHDADKVVGCGPYRLVEWKSGETIRLEKKAQWWGDPLFADHPSFAAAPDGLTFHIIKNPQTAITAIKDEIIDVTNALNTSDFVDLKEVKTVTDRYNLYTPPAMQIYYIAFNTKTDKLGDKRVRRALAHLLDIDAVINNLYFGLAERITVPFHPSKHYYDKSLQPIEFSVDKARALLKEAGWEDTNGNGIVDKEINGKLTEMKLDFLTTASSTFAANLATIMQENAKRAGVEIDISSKEFQAVKADWVKRDFDMYSSGFGVFPTDMDPKQIWHTESDVPTGGNRVGFGNAESDALIDEIRTTADKAKRRELYKKLQKIIYDEQPMIFLFAPQERLVIHKRFNAEPTVLNPGYVPSEFIIEDVTQN